MHQPIDYGFIGAYTYIYDSVYSPLVFFQEIENFSEKDGIKYVFEEQD